MLTSQWIIWLLAVSSGAFVSRVVTVIGRSSRPMHYNGWRGIVTSLNFLALLILLVVPFFALPWPWAIGATVFAAFLNPATYSISTGNLPVAIFASPYLSFVSISGAIYLAVI